MEKRSVTVAAVDVEALERDAAAAVAAASTPEELDEIRIRYLGRRSELKQALRAVRDRETGMTLNAVRERLEAAFDTRETELERDQLARREQALDVTLPGTQLRRRTHTSTGQIRVMEQRDPPIYIATLGRVYRRDTPSPRSTPNFHQVEALAVDRGITLADLKGTLMHFFRAMFGEGRDVRMRTSFFPFTEPSVEFDVTCFLCAGKGCAFCKHTGWFEMGGAGVVDPAVFERVGYDPEEWSGFAWGLGLDRIAAQRHGIPDIRMFWENDLRVLRQF